MLLSLPNPPPGSLNQYFARFTQALISSMQTVVSQKEPARQVILQAPNGTNYAVTVDNAGALIVAAISGKTPF